MASYDLSEDAEARLDEIYAYSIRTFGLETAQRYLLGLHDIFGLLAESPRLGAEQFALGRGMWRLVYRSHVVYYRPRIAGVFIVDVLHEAQDPTLRFSR
ncbi:MAG: type II toxin-antitoxin system RelE/ParE family toxin [Bryobacterales bacterium]